MALEYKVGGKPKSKSCKVLTWTMVPTTGESKIQFLMPKGLAPGDDYLLKVTSKVGFDAITFSIIP